jgi:hypothetical protein
VVRTTLESLQFRIVFGQYDAYFIYISKKWRDMPILDDIFSPMSRQLCHYAHFSYPHNALFLKMVWEGKLGLKLFSNAYLKEYLSHFFCQIKWEFTINTERIRWHLSSLLWIQILEYQFNTCYITQKTKETILING